MDTILALLLAQALLGAFDTYIIHEWWERLPQRPAARREVGLHGLREFLYAVIFLGLANWRWQGPWAWVLAAVLLVEVVITATDFVEEDRTRVLSPVERVTHLLLAVLYGALLAQVTAQLWHWQALPAGLVADEHSVMSWLITFFGLGVLLQSLRSAHAWWRLGPKPASIH